MLFLTSNSNFVMNHAIPFAKPTCKSIFSIEITNVPMQHVACD
jgi:hypothetical protein